MCNQGLAFDMGLDRHLCHTGSSGRQGRASRLLDARAESADPKTVWSGLARLGL